MAGVIGGTGGSADSGQPVDRSGRPIESLKWLVHVVAVAIVVPGWLLYRALIFVMPGRTNQLFQTASQCLSLLPGVPGVVIRRAFYGLSLRRCPRNVTISFGTVLSTPEAEIGQFVYVGAYCSLGKVTLGDDVLLGSNVDIMSGTRQHHMDRLDVPIRKQGGTFTRVRIGRDVWIGNGAIVAADVADQAVVAAGAVVVKPVEERNIVVGNPARSIGERGHRSEDARGESANDTT